jgi:Pyruvate/2-oxoacid:ferredoxin oxidoreductase delta subunit
VSALPATMPRVLIADELGTDPSARQRLFGLVRALLDRGYPVARVRNDAPPPAGDETVVVGSQALAAADASSIVEGLEQRRAERDLPAAGAWKPWFPVIDYDRCTNCMQCLSFCLFDVYGVSADRRIQVQNQSNCKTECPACSRVCPEVAIVFPKYRHGPINGDEVNADDVRREAMKVDISALLGGDVYAALRDRSAKAKSRFSKERDDERALKERQTCLVALQQGLDIPSEVLAALPDADEIRAKADAALARAQHVLNTSSTTSR